MKSIFNQVLAIIILFAATAKSETVFDALCNFSALAATNSTGVLTNSNGAKPQASLIASDFLLFGTASAGGTNGAGTIFRINTDGSGFTKLYEFKDKGMPMGNLLLSSNVLYGTTQYGGTNAAGTVFRIGINGNGFTNIYTFTALAHTNSGGVYTNSDGANSAAGLILSGNTLLGTTVNGGTNGAGTVFKVNTDGNGFSNIHTFNGGGGKNPQGGLAISGNRLYGTTQFGGTNGNGTIFALNTDGTDFTNLYSFSAITNTFNLTNNDGAFLNSGLVLVGGRLYGTALSGGLNQNGTIFAININGTGFTNLYNFSTTYFNSSIGAFTNKDGAKPLATLIVSNNMLYGTAELGGGGGFGTIFCINTNGGGFTNLYSFSTPVTVSPNVFTNADGGFPASALMLLDNSLYGTTMNCGSGAEGGVFVISLGPIPLHIQSNTNVILNWGNPAFVLQSTTNLANNFTTVPGSSSPYTNSTNKSQEFFRLQAN